MISYAKTIHLYYDMISNKLLYYTILCYTMLYYAMLCYTILYLYYTILNYTILYYTILYYTVIYYYIVYSNLIYHCITSYTIQGVPAARRGALRWQGPLAPELRERRRRELSGAGCCRRDGF